MVKAMSVNFKKIKSAGMGDKVQGWGTRLFLDMKMALPGLPGNARWPVCGLSAL